MGHPFACCPKCMGIPFEEASTMLWLVALGDHRLFRMTPQDPLASSATSGVSLVLCSENGMLSVPLLLNPLKTILFFPWSILIWFLPKWFTNERRAPFLTYFDNVIGCLYRISSLTEGFSHQKGRKWQLSNSLAVKDKAFCLLSKCKNNGLMFFSTTVSFYLLLNWFYFGFPALVSHQPNCPSINTCHIYDRSSLSAILKGYSVWFPGIALLQESCHLDLLCH